MIGLLVARVELKEQVVVAVLQLNATAALLRRSSAHCNQGVILEVVPSPDTELQKGATGLAERPREKVVQVPARVLSIAATYWAAKLQTILVPLLPLPMSPLERIQVTIGHAVA